MATQPQINEQKLDEFMGKVIGDLSGTLVTTMCVLGDRLGLFKDLASNGSATSEQLASRTGTKERYVREWLGSLSSAGYIEYDPASKSFTLPPEHAMALAQEGGPAFVSGVHQMVIGMLGPIDELTEAFRQGGGVPQTSYGNDMWTGMERFTGTWFGNLLIQQWIPAMPHVQSKLESGASVADIGSGNGQALIKLAQTFPNSTYIGYDVYAPAAENATSNAQAAGVGNRVSFKHLDVSQGIPDQHDLITTFDVIHDMVDPRGALKSIRGALKPDGSYLMLEPNVADTLEGNAGPLGAMWYGFSVLYCTTTSLAHGGEGLGAVGLPPSKVRELCTEAGFGQVNQLPIENPFSILYEMRL